MDRAKPHRVALPPTESEEDTGDELEEDLEADLEDDLEEDSEEDSEEDLEAPGAMEDRALPSGIVPEEIVDRLRTALPVSAVILFGSRARGDHTQHSDTDLAVVSPDFAGEPRMFRRVARLQDALPHLRRVDLVGLSPEELEAVDSLLVLDIVDEGRPLHDDGAFARARQRLEAKRSAGEVQRIPGGWRILSADP